MEDKNQKTETPITFSTFIFSLSSSAFLHFGEMLNPHTGQKEVNIAAARQTIDIIAMLQEKTKNNLTNEEATLIDKILYDLRLKYMDLCKDNVNKK